MTTRYYRDNTGNYLGGFDGAAPPADAIEVPDPPADARQKWSATSSAWAAAPVDTSQDYIGLYRRRADDLEDAGQFAEALALRIEKGIIST